ncbi:MAG: response regulator [Bacillota bacterium]|nr:response regulator [Bacillota bacterium]
MTTSEKAKILIVDDLADNRLALKMVLKREGYRILEAENGEDCLKIVEKAVPDLILLDAMMPGISGYQVAKVIKEDLKHIYLPIIMITALNQIDDKVKALDTGIDDFISKPFDRVELRARIKSLLRLKKYNEQLIHINKVVVALANAIEARDPYTFGHTERVAQYALLLAEKINMTPEEKEQVHLGAIIHDIGKISVSESILNKPGPLTCEEWEVMRKHPEIGYNILKPMGISEGVLRVVLEHQEKLDGSGYPLKLVKEQISLASQVVMIADIFDALTSDRPYKKAYSFDKATKILVEEAIAGKLDIKLVNIFIEAIKQEGERDLA